MPRPKRPDVPADGTVVRARAVGADGSLAERTPKPVIPYEGDEPPVDDYGEDAIFVPAGVLEGPITTFYVEAFGTWRVMVQRWACDPNTVEVV